MKQGWEHAKQIFVNAIGVAPDERLRFVERECSGNEALYNEVKSLLDSYKDDSFLETPAVTQLAETLSFDTPELTSEQSFGHFKIIRQLGKGGMGEVYLAEDTKLSRKVAIKVLNKRIGAHADNIERFTREARAASALNHPNILVIHETGEADKAKYIVSEFVDGQTLREFLKGSPISVSTVLDIAIQIASALTAAHGEHIIHRDIKPENMMVRPDGLVKVLDFGLAKLMTGGPALVGSEGPTQIHNQTAKGMILGTVNYMSPEQAKGERVDERTDIFSLGALIYEMVAGRPPFEGDSLSETFANLIKAEPAPLSQYAENLPIELHKIVTKLLKKNRDERYQKMLDVLSDLRELRDNLAFDDRLERSKSARDGGQPAEISNDSSSKLQANTFGGKRRIWMITAVFALVVLAGSLGAYYLFSNRSRPPAPSERKTLAILPFVNSSQDPNVEYLSDGITENIINSLSQVSGLKVMSRNSSFRFKDDQNDVQGIASKLGVENVITGDIKQLGDRLVINVHLIDATDDSQIWGNQYVRSSSDIFAVQTEIASEVAQYLRVRLTDNETQLLKKRYTDNVEAYQLYLRGKYSWNKHTLEDVRKSIDYYDQSLEKDANYALAYSGLSAAYGVLGNNYLPPREAFPKAKTYAAKALEIDDTLAEAHGAMAAVDLYYDWDLTEAEKQLKRAEELDPDLSQIYLLDADRLEILGRFDEAARKRKRALEIEPLLPQFNFVAGATSYLAGQYDDAITQLEKTVELEPRYYQTYLFLGNAYEQKGMYAKAIDAYERGITQGHRGPDLVAALGHVYALEDERDKAEKALAELRKMSSAGYVSPYWFAVVYAGLNDREQTLAWLEKAYQERSNPLIWLNVEPQFKPLRGDVRFQNLVKRIGL